MRENISRCNQLHTPVWRWPAGYRPKRSQIWGRHGKPVGSGGFNRRPFYIDCTLKTGHRTLLGCAALPLRPLPVSCNRKIKPKPTKGKGKKKKPLSGSTGSQKGASQLDIFVPAKFARSIYASGNQYICHKASSTASGSNAKVSAVISNSSFCLLQKI